MFGWTAEGFDLGGTEVSLWRLPGYVGGEPAQPVPRDVVATMAPSDDGAPAGWSVDFWIDDLDLAAGRTQRLGGSVLVPPYEIPGAPMRQAVLADPAGASFSVTELTAPPRES